MRRVADTGLSRAEPLAYQQRCAICRLRHDELLEAAHSLPLPPRELKGCVLAGTFDASRRARIESLP